MRERCRASSCHPATAAHFRSFDGKTRSLLVEGSGGPTWYTEYNVLTGLSARSYGRLSYYVTRIAAGRVKRGLPQALKHCGYKTISLYPAYGAFLSAKKFQETAGIGRFVDSADMKAGDVEPDRFYFDQALKTIQSRAGRPAAVRHGLYGVQSLPVVELAAARTQAGLAQPRQRARGRRISPAPVDHRARLCRLQGAAWRRLPGPAFPGVAFRRSSARHGPDDRSGRHRGDDLAADHELRPAILHHLLRHRCRQLRAQSMCRRRSIGWRRLIFLSLCWRRPACRSTRPSRNKRKFSSAATGCSSSAPAAPRLAASTGC